MVKSVIAIIMAGGLGKRMESAVPKVLHKINGVEMINHVLKNLIDINNNIDSEVKLEKIIIVVGKYQEQIREAIENKYTIQNNSIKINSIKNTVITYVTQNEPLGTGHAIMCCIKELRQYPFSKALIVSGDVPALSKNTILQLLDNENNVSLITATLEEPIGYGRIIEINDGVFDKIVEQKDCNPEQVNIKKVNGGIYCIQSNLLCEYLPHLKNDNSQKEYYLTDIIEIIKSEEQETIGMLHITDDKVVEIIGVNTISQLKDLELLLQKQPIN